MPAAETILRQVAANPGKTNGTGVAVPGTRYWVDVEHSHGTVWNVSLQKGLFGAKEDLYLGLDLANEPKARRILDAVEAEAKRRHAAHMSLYSPVTEA